MSGPTPRSDPYRDAADALKDTEARPEDFGPLLTRLLKVANVESRDVTAKSDRVRFGSIGFFVILFTCYAFLGWLAFLSTIGLEDLGGKAIAIAIGSGVALAAAVSTAVFDRTVVGQTAVDLSYTPQLVALIETEEATLPPEPPPPSSARPFEPGRARAADADPDGTAQPDGTGLPDEEPSDHDAPADDDGATYPPRPTPNGDAGVSPEDVEDRGYADAPQPAVPVRASAPMAPVLRRETFKIGDLTFPNLVIKPSLVVYLFRILLAVVIAFFATQAIDLRVFASEITLQRAKHEIALLEERQAAHEQDHDTAVAKHRKRVSDNEAQVKKYHDLAVLAHRGSRNLCIGPECRRNRALQVAAARDLAAARKENPDAKGSPIREQYVDRRVFYRNRIAELQQHPERLPSKSEGPLKGTADLFGYMSDNPLSFLVYGAMLFLALAVDLAAILLKSRGRNRTYERRQALRDWAAFQTTQLAVRAQSEANARARIERRRADQFALGIRLEAAQTEAAVQAATQRARREALNEAHEAARVRRRAAEWAAGRIDDELNDDPTPQPGPPPPRPPPEKEPPPPRTALDSFEAGDTLPSTGAPKWMLDEEIPSSQQGQHSRVWRAHAIATGEPVAIKLMLAVRGNRADENREYMRARNEIARLRDLEGNPHVVRLRGFGVEGDVVFCVMPLASQGSLASYYSPAGRGLRPLGEVLYFAAMIVEALRATDDAVSGSGSAAIVHRDIKPENVLLHDHAAVHKGYPEVWLADWGVSLLHSASAAIADVAPATVAYAAPQAVDRSQSVHILDDIYSIGLLLWWCMTGNYARWEEMPDVPHTEAEVVEYAHELALKREQLPSLTERYPRLPVDVEAFIRKSLSYERHGRTSLDYEDADRRQVLDEASTELQRLINRVDALERGTSPILVGPGLARTDGNGTDASGAARPSGPGPGGLPPTRPASATPSATSEPGFTESPRRPQPATRQLDVDAPPRRGFPISLDDWEPLDEDGSPGVPGV